MKREINLRRFTTQVSSHRNSGPVLVALMHNDDLDIARFYLAKSKLEGLEYGEKFDIIGYIALLHAACVGHIEVLKALLAAGSRYREGQ